MAIARCDVPVRNERLQGFSCVRCGNCYGVEDFWEGCPRCLGTGHPSSVSAIYAGNLDPLERQRCGAGFRYSVSLPYRAGVSLGEGSTPLIELRQLASALDVSSVHLKNEASNPTGSHKDRMTVQAIARALDIKARRVICASSGNAGISMAAYAVAASIESEAVVTESVSLGYLHALHAYGAKITCVKDSIDRWRYVEREVRMGNAVPLTNYLLPPVGSNPFGVDGLKTIAFELIQDLADGWPTAIIVPTSRGDLLWGIYVGFAEVAASNPGLGTLPRLFAAEPFPRLRAVLDGASVCSHFNGKSAQLSIGGNTVTFQAFEAIRRSGGEAAVVTDAAAAEAQSCLGKLGIYAELSSAASLAALRQLVAAERITQQDRVVLIATSSGWKDP